MTPVLLLTLLGLAVADSTSVGTLVVPLLLLAHPRVRVYRVLLYLLTLSLFYLGLGVALLLGADALGSALRPLADSSWVDGVRSASGCSLS